ncbi:MAG: acyltransferase [Sediminibacterium sp.]|nr:acyltransferase [Sediminibacterium sp.]
MKTLFENIIRLRNPNFSFDPDISTSTIMAFTWLQVCCLIRGLKLIFYGKQPKTALLGKGVSFFNASQLQFGKYMRLGDGVHISALGKKGISIGNNVSIGSYSRLIVSASFNDIGEYIKIGNNVGMGEYSYLGGAGGLEIGDECIIGQYLSCHPENHNTGNIQESIRHQGVTRKGIKIGKNCWIGSKVSILDGVEIGDGCIIAAGALVNKTFPPNSVIGGVPARILKQRTNL